MKVICFEGVNGVGKSVICDNICETLKRENFNVIRLREPGGSVIGEKILRPLLKNEQMVSASLTPDARLYLFLASRALNANYIKSVQDVDYIILDRYTPSTLVYNGLMEGKDLQQVYDMEKVARKDIIPDATFYIDAKDSEIVSRIWQRDYPKHDTGNNCKATELLYAG
jgi:dTMP kinase